VLIDCGLYQGSREIAEENAGDFGFDPAGIDFALLTHAHLDHCGRLPLLTRCGFRGEIIATTATHELARLVMLDAAHLQEEEARSNSHRPRHGADNKSAEPLFTVADTLKSLESLSAVRRMASRPISPKASARLLWTPDIFLARPAFFLN
jgi:metallo-beta-lactamase family protein